MVIVPGTPECEVVLLILHLKSNLKLILALVDLWTLQLWFIPMSRQELISQYMRKNKDCQPSCHSFTNSLLTPVKKKKDSFSPIFYASTKISQQDLTSHTSKLPILWKFVLNVSKSSKRWGKERIIQRARVRNLILKQPDVHIQQFCCYS